MQRPNHLYSSYLLTLLRDHTSLYLPKTSVSPFLVHLSTAWVCPTQQWQVIFAEFGSVFDLNLNFSKDQKALDLSSFVMKRGPTYDVIVLTLSPSIFLTCTCLNRTRTQAPVWVSVQHQPYCRGT